jgi:aspartyl-tRNA synthetase
VPFPKTASGADPLTGAPTEIPDPVLRELGIATQTPNHQG